MWVARGQQPPSRAVHSFQSSIQHRGPDCSCLRKPRPPANRAAAFLRPWKAKLQQQKALLWCLQRCSQIVAAIAWAVPNRPILGYQLQAHAFDKQEVQYCKYTQKSLNNALLCLSIGGTPTLTTPVQCPTGPCHIWLRMSNTPLPDPTPVCLKRMSCTCSTAAALLIPSI